jgi:hypothetical protein
VERDNKNATEQKDPINGMENILKILFFKIQDENGNSIDEKVQ